MYQKIVIGLLPFLLLAGCKESIKEKEKPKENSITLIKFNMNDSLGFNIAGWGVGKYYYLNLNNDSVFTHLVDSFFEKVNSIENNQVF